MDIFLSQLNEPQREVVQTTAGPLLVLAGAGSGKTRALTYRIAYMIREKIARPDQVLAVTFTNKAAREMRQRVVELLPGSHSTPAAIGTFHGLGARLLRENSQRGTRSSRFIIIDSQDAERLIRQAVHKENLSPKEWGPARLHHFISRAKNSMVTAADMLASASSDQEEITARIFGQYEQLLAAQDAYDFDDLLIQPIRLLEEQPAIRRAYQERWPFLLVDEYQDTNPPQDRLLQLLLGPAQNICVVGDDYQAIYSWRGARVDHILQFESSFPHCKTIYLTENYRSTPQILEAANQVIAENTAQKHKKLWTAQPRGSAVQLRALPSDRQEVGSVRMAIEQHVAQGGRLIDCVVLYRTNAQSRLFEEEFLTHHIPYTIIGGFRFYERREIKEALAFLHFWINPRSLLPLQRIMGPFIKGIGPKTMARWAERATQEARSLAEILQEEALIRPGLRPLTTTYQTARQKQFGTVAELLKYLLDHSGYSHYIKQEVDGVERWENIEELFNVCAPYTEVSVFLEEVALLTDLDTLNETQDRVTCMTLHASKGLEFPYVFLVGCEEGLLPHINSLDQATTLEEERRLLYVGMTRAKRKLILSYAHSRFVRGEALPQLPSRFLQALPPTIEWIDMTSEPARGESNISQPFMVTVEVGEFITHPHFGRGVVIEQQGSLATCVFEEYGVRTIDTSLLNQPEKG